MSAIFDFFVSYKRKDAESFAVKLAVGLRAMGCDVWLDHDEIHPGESILASVENGMRSSIDAVLVLSANYFDGWSEQERRAIFGLMTSRKLRIIPVWYRIGQQQVQRAAPMLADIKAIEVDGDADDAVARACGAIARSFRPQQRRSRLFEIFFRCVSTAYPDDWDLKLFLAVFDNDTEALKRACEAGADVNITDAALWNRYNRLALECGCFDEWRKLFLHLSEAGQIGNG